VLSMQFGVFIVDLIALVVYSNIIQCTYSTFKYILMYLKVFTYKRILLNMYIVSL
jgi:hypothetical protein